MAARRGPAGEGVQVAVVAPSAISADVRARWASLLADSPVRMTPFLHPDVAAAAATVAPGTAVAVLRRRGEVVGVLPFERRGPHAVAVAADVSDGDGLVAAPDLRLDLPSVVRAMGVRSLRYHHRDRGHPSPLARFDHWVTPSARVDLAGGFDAYAARLPSTSVLKEAARKRRRMERDHGPVSFTLDDDHAHAERLLAWKRGQVTAREGAARPVPAAEALIRALGDLPSRSEVRSSLSVLRAGDRVVALHWGLRLRGLFVSAVPTFDPALARSSPGLVLHDELLRALADAGVEEIDLGLDVNQTKRRLMTHTAAVASGQVFAGPAGRAYRRLRTAARQLRNRPQG